MSTAEHKQDKEDDQGLIPLQRLSISQLNTIKDQVEKELDFFTASHSQLKQALERFSQAQEALRDLEGTSKRDILVPMTPSVYVNGYLPPMSLKSKVKVDIGTGYYVEKNIEEAKTYFQAKVSYLAQQIEMIQKNIYIKQDTLLSIVGEMQLKMATSK